MNTFRGKIIWITGASSGIGRELAIQLSRLDAICILSARTLEALQKTASLMKGSQAFILPLDMEKGEFETAVEQVLNKFNKVDYLILNAGISQRSPARDTSEDVDRRLMEINYFGPVKLTKLLLPHMRKRREGTIAFTSSLAGKFGYYQRSAYAASKHAMQGFFETLALEEEKSNIRIRIVCPAGVNTGISQNALAGNGETYGKPSELQEEGAPVEEAVGEIIKALAGNRLEVLIGTPMEKISLKVKALFPALFWNLIRKKRPADIEL